MWHEVSIEVCLPFTNMFRRFHEESSRSNFEHTKLNVDPKVISHETQTHEPNSRWLHQRLPTELCTSSATSYHTFQARFGTGNCRGGCSRQRIVRSVFKATKTCAEGSQQG
mmetsp:Transcript_170057/g.545448  ORF Transcript_170057/g.545448 Transcript_170057/m.545448 type:complete len:111 (-) Transcript_170057:373-705(-)